MKFEKCILTAEELKNLCVDYQTLLGLTDWTLFIRVVDSEKMLEGFDDSLKDAPAGKINIDFEHAVGVISILDQPSYEAMNPIVPQDMEHSLVHELLHIWFQQAIQGKDWPWPVAEERAINEISLALVKLHRRSRTSSRRTKI